MGQSCQDAPLLRYSAEKALLLQGLLLVRTYGGLRKQDMQHLTTNMDAL